MKTFSEQFRERARRTPDAIALIFGDERISYAVLASRLDALAHDLRVRGIRRGARVAICLRNSPELVLALLAIAELRAAYVGIDPDWPAARARDVLEDAAPSLLVVDGEETGRALHVDGAIVIPPDWRRAGAPVVASSSDDHGVVHPDELFAVLYTSGSTGKPKGVLVTVGSVMNKLESLWKTYSFQPDDIAFLYRSPTTAGFSTECFAALLEGVPTVVSAVNDTRDVHALADAARRAGVTYCGASVGFWETLIDRVERHPETWPGLRLARCSGAPMPPSTVARWRRALPNARLLNIYGTTECSGSANFETSMFDDPDTGATRVPIGRPISGVEMILLDEALRPAGPQQPGELYVGGASLARGYLADPARTGERFVPHPSGPPGARLFRTGDIGVQRADGWIEIIGRRDLQVKVRGYRVEIEEVEAALRRCPGVRHAAVRGDRDPAGGVSLTAFVVVDAADAWRTSALSLRRALEETLPGYMVPAAIVSVDALPETANGKIDRLALSALRIEQTGPPPSIVLPETATEKRVAPVWSEVLGLAEIGRDDDFFEIGGHSLSGTQIVSRLEDAFGTAIPLRVLFDHPSIGEFAREIDRLMAASAATLGQWRTPAATSGQECRR